MKKDFTPGLPSQEISELSPYDRCLSLLVSDKAKHAEREIQGWIAWLEGGRERKLSTAKMARLAVLEGTSKGPRRVMPGARTIGRKAAKQTAPAEPDALHPCLLSRPAPPIRPDQLGSRVRPFLAALAAVFAMAPMPTDEVST